MRAFTPYAASHTPGLLRHGASSSEGTAAYPVSSILVVPPAICRYSFRCVLKLIFRRTLSSRSRSNRLVLRVQQPWASPVDGWSVTPLRGGSLAKLDGTF